MCDYDGDGADVVLRSAFVTARKVHKCFACRERIKAGDRYHIEQGKWDGEFTTYKHCLRCWSMVQALWRIKGLTFVEFGLDCGEIWDDPPESVAALAFALPGDALEGSVPP